MKGGNAWPITEVQRADVKSVRIIHCLVLLIAASQIWGCASASVGFQTNGTYVLERNEQSADCQVLHKNISGRIQVLKGLPVKARAEQRSIVKAAAARRRATAAAKRGGGGVVG